MRAVPMLLVLLVACGDNGGGAGDDAMNTEPCEPTPPELPTTGLYTNPQAMPLADCVQHGLRDIAGRWFIVDPKQYFRFEYPKYEGSCETGFRRYGLNEDDHDAEDGYTFHTWSDGTRIFQRTAFQFEETVFISAYAACMRADGTLSAAYINYDNERGERISQATGTRFGPKDEEPSHNMVLRGELGSVGDRPIKALNLVIDGTRAYVVGFTGLDIIDISDPAAPLSLGHHPGEFNDVRVVNDGTNVVAFLSPSGDDRTSVVNVTNPSAPTIVSLLEEYSHSLFIQERNNTKELYLATYNDSVPKYDVTSPLTPVRQGMAIVPGEVSGVHDLFVAGDTIYANNTAQGLVAFDVSTGLANEVELGRFTLGYSHASWAGTIGTRKLVLAGDEGMTRSAALGAHLSILEGDPQSPMYMKEIAKYQTRPEVGIHNFEVHGNHAFIAYYQDGVRVVDLSTPEQPVEVARYHTWDAETAYGGAFEGAVGIRRVGDYIYVADLTRGLMIFQVGELLIL